VAERIELDKGDLGRLERGTTKAEKGGQSIAKAAENAGKFAGSLIQRFGNLARRSEAFLAGTGLESSARRASDVALATVAGARTGAALGGALPLPGSGLVGAGLGGAAGAKLGSQIEAGRQEAARLVLQVENEAFERARRREAIEAEGERRFLAKHAEQEERAKRVDLGLGDPARLAALRRAIRGGS
jgi:hypothetical protein